MALELGVWDVDGMLNQMSLRQFRGWVAYHEIEPFGEERRDLRAASIVAMLANLQRKRGAKARPISDFVLDFGPQKKKGDHRSKENQDRMKMMGAMIAGQHKAKAK